VFVTVVLSHETDDVGDDNCDMIFFVKDFESVKISDQILLPSRECNKICCSLY